MTSLENFGYRQELKRTLSIRDLVVYGMVFMVPISPFGVFGFVWRDAKGMVPLAYLLGLIGMFFTAMSYASMSRAFPMAGSVYSYVGRGLHETAGFFAGWLILLDYILVPALLYIFSAAALRPLLPGVPDFVWLMGFVSFNAAVNLVGIQLTARINLYMLLIEIVALALFVVIGLAALYGGQGAGSLTLKPLYDPSTFSMATIAGATSIAVLSFLGFDGVSTLAEESHGGGGAVARATVASLLAVGSLFILQTWIAADLAQGVRFSSPETAFYEIAERAGGAGLRTIAIGCERPGFAVSPMRMVAQAARSRGSCSRWRATASFRPCSPGFIRGIERPPTSAPSWSPASPSPWDCCSRTASTSSPPESSTSERSAVSCCCTWPSSRHHIVIRGGSRAWLRHLAMPLAGFAVVGYVLYEMDAAAKILGAVWIGAGILYFAVLSLLLKRSPALEL